MTTRDLRERVALVTNAPLENADAAIAICMLEAAKMVCPDCRAGHPLECDLNGAPAHREYAIGYVYTRLCKAPQLRAAFAHHGTIPTTTIASATQTPHTKPASDAARSEGG